MINKSLTRRLEQLEECLLPVNAEPLILKIIAVSPDGKQTDSGIEFRIDPVPKPFKRGRW